MADTLKLDFRNVSIKTGFGNVHIYYSHKRDVKPFPTGIKLHKDFWDKKNKKIKKGGLTDEEMMVVDTMYNQIQTIILHYMRDFSGSKPSIPEIEERLIKPVEYKQDFYSLYKEYCATKKVENDNDNTLRSMEQVPVSLKEFEESSRPRIKITLGNISHSLILDYILFLQEKDLLNNTINVRLSYLQGFSKWLDDKEIPHKIEPKKWPKLSNNSPSNFHCLERKEYEAIRDFVTPEYVTKIVKGKEVKRKATPKEIIKNEHLRDTIIFLAETGLRFEDIYNIKEVKNYIKSSGTIHFEPSKTSKRKVNVMIPLTKNTREILEKYEYELPKYSNAGLRTAIHNFCKQITIFHKIVEKKKLKDGKIVTEELPKYKVLNSHSVGRKTFINLCLERNLQITTIMSMTGHTKITTLLKFYINRNRDHQNELQSAFD